MSSAERLDLPRLIRQEEGQFFDRKSLWHGKPDARRPRDRREVRDEIAEYVAAFANADGGILVLGVEDDGTPTGFSYPDDVIEQFLNVPRTRLSRPLVPGRVAEVEGVSILVFEAEPAATAVMVQGNGFPYRVKDETIKLEESRINAIKREGQVESWEAQPARHGFDAIDEALVARACEGAGLAGLPPEEYLVKRHLADRRAEGLVLRRAALLLFGATPEVLDHPFAGLRIFRVNGTERLHGARHNVDERPRIEGNLTTVLEAARAAISGLIRKSARLHDLFFRETPEYPIFAWQEALVNAVAHRDYAVRSRSVEIWLYDDRMEVSSPGGLLAEVSLEDLVGRKGVHGSRNPRVARCLVDLGIMREQGEGIPRMFEEMETSFLPLPDISSDHGSFSVTLRNTPILEAGDPDWARYVRALPWRVAQKRALVGFAGRDFTNEDYRRLNGADRDRTYREMKELVAVGLVDRVGDGPRTVYRVAPSALRAASSSAEAPARSAEAWIAAALRTQGSISNGEVRVALSMDRGEVKALLRELARKDVLEVRGKKRGARWFPATHFAKWSEMVLSGANSAQ